VAEEIREIAEQLEHERALFGGTSTKALIKELLTIPSNRKRAFIIIMVMVWQQFTGVNAVVSPCSTSRKPPGLLLAANDQR
jgi:hypothetical protein